MIGKLESYRGPYYRLNQMLNGPRWAARSTLGGYSVTTPLFYGFIAIPFKGRKIKRLNAERRARLRASR